MSSQSRSRGSKPRGTPAGSTRTAGKDDAGKLRFDLIPPEALEALAYVYTIGAVKYDDNNWRRGGLKFGRMFAAMQRHAMKWQRGETTDSEDGQHHLASVAWYALSLLILEKEQPADDDRWKENA